MCSKYISQYYMNLDNHHHGNVMEKYIQSEYKYYSSIIESYSEHIEKSYNDNIIDNKGRMQHVDTLYNIVQLMNNIYIDNIANDEHNKNIIMITESNNTEQIVDLLNIYKSIDIDNINDININIFDGINDKLLELSTKIGFKNIGISIKILFGKYYDIDKYIGPPYDIIQKYFIPLSYKKKQFNSKKYNVTVIQTDHENDILLDNFYKIEITIPPKKICITYEGYFMNNNINTIQNMMHVCHQNMFKKKELLLKCNCVNKKFIDSYIKNMSIGELISIDENNFEKILTCLYDRYSRLSRMSFKNIVNEFTNNKSTLREQYNIIKLLLIGGTIDNVNTAGLLYGLTKDKKYGSEYLSSIIYKNLNHNLQTQLKISSTNIKTEMIKLKNISIDNTDIKKQIVACTNMPQYVKKITLDKYEEMKSGNGTDYYKQKTFVDILTNYPWLPISVDENDMFKTIGSNKEKSKDFLNNVMDTLNKKVYGHDECKNVIQEMIGKWLANPKSSGKSIGLVGPPGVGKTMIAKAIGDALCIPFTQINIGGMDDRCILSGHSYTYNSAQPGLIVRKMVEAGSSRCIIYFDELDKATTRNGINEIHNILIHVTDPNTNTQYSDAFFSEINFNLEKVLFIFSYNDPEKVDSILLDRMEKIDVKPYVMNDKIKISRDYLIKEIASEINMDHNYIQFNDETIEYLIENYTFEAGVRELKRKFESIYSKINLDKIFNRNIFSDGNTIDHIIMDNNMINKYLDKPNLNIKQIHKNNEIGIVNGLYATNSGSGGIIPILIYENHIGDKQKFSLKLTGSQGKVMKESVSFAFTIAGNLIKKKYRDLFVNKSPYGLHIHTPDAATPKDGPSAGCAFTTAFISRILGIKIKRDVAMTGEIELNGNITAIGGLVYKLRGAQKAGVKTVFIPSENKADLDKIISKDPDIAKDLDIRMVDHIYDILKYALIDNNIDETKMDRPFDLDMYLNT